MSSFAVIKTGGKQYRVAVGDVITIEKLSKGGLPIPAGDKVTFDEVLLVDDGKNTTLGTPTISGASVTGTVEVQGKTRTLIVGKFKNKTNYRKRIGHRHRFTKVTIDAIK
jgi:large subunit ribosomal protein L21